MRLKVLALANDLNESNLFAPASRGRIWDEPKLRRCLVVRRVIYGPFQGALNTSRTAPVDTRTGGRRRFSRTTAGKQCHANPDSDQYWAPHTITFRVSRPNWSTSRIIKQVEVRICYGVGGGPAAEVDVVGAVPAVTLAQIVASSWDAAPTGVGPRGQVKPELARLGGESHAPSGVENVGGGSRCCSAFARNLQLVSLKRRKHREIVARRDRCCTPKNPFLERIRSQFLVRFVQSPRRV